MAEPSRHLATYFIAGFQYWDGAFVINKLKPGVQLRLVCEPDNANDPNSVAVYYQDAKLGFIPKSENDFVAKASYFGHANMFEMRVLQVRPKAAPWEQLRLGLYVKNAR